MKKLLLFLSVVILGSSAYSQPLMKLSKTEHNFGKFKEEAGKQSFDIVVTNTGNAPLVIQNIQASCGCTQPDWSKEPIHPGGPGEITANYHPANRPGQFSKTHSVNTNP